MRTTALAVWNVQNSALDANTWDEQLAIAPNNLGIVRPLTAWRNLHEYNLAFGGPIKKNKTFFYTLWDQQIVRHAAHVESHRPDGMRAPRDLPLLRQLSTTAIRGSHHGVRRRPNSRHREP